MSLMVSPFSPLMVYPFPPADGVALSPNRPYSRKYYEILEKRQKLPVHNFLDDLIEKVKRNSLPFDLAAAERE